MCLSTKPTLAYRPYCIVWIFPGYYVSAVFPSSLQLSTKQNVFSRAYLHSIKNLFGYKVTTFFPKMQIISVIFMYFLHFSSKRKLQNVLCVMHIFRTVSMHFRGFIGPISYPTACYNIWIYYPVSLKHMFPHTQHVRVLTYKSHNRIYKLFIHQSAIYQQLTNRKYKSKNLHIIYFLL